VKQNLLRKNAHGLECAVLFSYNQPNLKYKEQERSFTASMYKLIAIDVDDTLLTDNLTVTEGTKRAMEAAIAQGVTVTLATGRMFASAQKIAKQIELNVPIITYQGALVKTLLDGQVLYERNVPVDAAKELHAYVEANGLHLQLYVNDELYGTEDNDKIKAYSKLSNIPYKIEPDFNKLLDFPMNKMLIIDDPAKLDIIAEELKLLIGDRVHITKSKAHYLEFMHKEGTKGHALRFMAEHLGCSMDQTIALGDAWNDNEMILAAGLGVAMGNAIQSLKDIADYVTLSNNEEGVRHVIEKFVLEASAE
jgi:Cof subfamily protein (haloacid dehalogenase superfamily)